MAIQTTPSRETSQSVGVSQHQTPQVDTRSPRFGQAVTSIILLVGIGLQEPLFIVASAIPLVLAVLSGWRLSVYGTIWQTLVRPVVGEPAETDSALPHRFATIVGASFDVVAVAFLFAAPVAGMPTLAFVGYAFAFGHLIAAVLGGFVGYCLGCKMYRQVAFVRRLNLL